MTVKDQYEDDGFVGKRAPLVTEKLVNDTDTLVKLISMAQEWFDHTGSSTMVADEYSAILERANGWISDDFCIIENKALMQILHDPENQPSQFGTVPSDDLERKYSRVVMELTKRLTAAKRALTHAPDGWQDISTAPKTKCQFLVTDWEPDDGILDGRYHSIELVNGPFLADGRILNQNSGNYSGANSWKYWCPVPAAPLLEGR